LLKLERVIVCWRRGNEWITVSVRMGKVGFERSRDEASLSSGIGGAAGFSDEEAYKDDDDYYYPYDTFYISLISLFVLV